MQLYRRIKAKVVVDNRRLQVTLELAMANSAKYESIWIPLQCLVRRYVTRYLCDVLLQEF